MTNNKRPVFRIPEKYNVMYLAKYTWCLEEKGNVIQYELEAPGITGTIPQRKQIMLTLLDSEGKDPEKFA